MKPILEIKNISKKYKLRGQESPYLTFRDALMSGFKGKKTKDEFWALQDISFDVYPGESIGIIGRNGAGKSTLLKILSRITPPTKGQIISRGRIASLLEVGTGFHMELTGRENVFLNGSILGLSKQEIKAKFDEIVIFSGVERFLDTPLKHYSSGMQLRLAFSVAAHLEPEILIIDEVLAVGDVAFQNKCINKMEDVGKEGKTIIIVSHNMSSISRLCTKALLIENGNLKIGGKVDQVIKNYLTDKYESISEKNWDLKNAPGDDKVKLLSIKVVNEINQTQEVFDIRHSIYIEFDYIVVANNIPVSPAFHLYNSAGINVFISIDFYNETYITKKKGRYITSCLIPGNTLAEETYYVQGIITAIDHVQAPKNYLSLPDVIGFQVVDKMEGGSARKNHKGQYYGVVRPIMDWKTKKLTN